MYQTRNKDRYDEGFAKSKLQLTKNWQYARYHQLGGEKVYIKEPGTFSDASASDGKGAWSADAYIGATPPTIIWTVDANNVTWITVKLSFADQLFYLTDVNGAEEAANMVTFDPTVKDTISWDVKINALDGTLADQWFWNSTTNDGFEAVYFSGYLKFGDGVVAAVAKNYKAPAINVYLAGDMLKIQGMDKANLKVYSVVGQLVKSANSVKELNISDLTQGVYLVKLNDLSQSFKVVKR
jgi:hypothetical protein